MSQQFQVVAYTVTHGQTIKSTVQSSLTARKAEVLRDKLEEVNARADSTDMAIVTSYMVAPVN